MFERASSNIFDKIYVCVVEKSNKDTLFTSAERIELAKKSLNGIEKEGLIFLMI